MWSLGHICFIISPFLLTVLLYFICKNWNQEKRRKLGIIASYVAIGWLVLRNIEIFVVSGWRIQPEIIPLQICHFANFVLLFAFLKKNDVLFSFAFCFNLPAAIMSILFANSLENYTTLITFRAGAYIFGHILIVAITLFAWVFNFIKMDKKVLLKTIGLLFILYIGSTFVNHIFNAWMPDFSSNYFYSLQPEAGTPLEIFFEWSRTVSWASYRIKPLYLFLTGILGVAIIFFFYGIDLLKEKLFPQPVIEEPKIRFVNKRKASR